MNINKFLSEQDEAYLKGCFEELEGYRKTGILTEGEVRELNKRFFDNSPTMHFTIGELVYREIAKRHVEGKSDSTSREGGVKTSSFIPSKDDLQEVKEFMDKFTDNYGVALRVKMLIEQAEKVRKQQQWIELIEEKYEKMRLELDANGDYLPLDSWKHKHKDW